MLRFNIKNKNNTVRNKSLMTYLSKTILITSIAIICASYSTYHAKAMTQDSTKSQKIVNIDSLKRIDHTVKPKEFVIRSIKTQGLKYINEQILLNTSGIVVGDTIIIPGTNLNQAARKLWDQRYFSDVKIKTDLDGDNVDVIFVLKERARVANWGFIGLKKTQQEELIEKLNLRRGSELTEYMMDNSIRLIREYMNEKANRKGTIDYDIQPDSLIRGGLNVNFIINMGKKQKIKEIKIEGTKALNPKKVGRAMKKTKALSINIFNDTKFNDKEFPADKQLIINYMKSKGYRDAKIIEDSLYDINEKRIGVYIKVDEGKKYYYRDITWMGNSKYPTDYLADYVLGIKKGDAYDSETMASRLGSEFGKTEMGETSIDGIYKDDGYLAFMIKPFETADADSVDVEIRIIEGKQFRIGDVTFEGNTRTNDHVIRRELETVPGDLYSQSLLMRTYQRLASMGQFDPNSLEPNVIPNMQTEIVDINYALSEVRNDQFELSAGWGGGMFIGSLGVKFTNVSLRKFFDKNAWRPYPAGDNQTIGLNIQSNGTYYRALSANFVEPWLGGEKPTNLSVSFYTSRESSYGEGYNMWNSNSSSYFGTIGGTVSLSKRLTWPDPFFSLSVGATIQSYKMVDWDYFIIENGRSNTFAINVGFQRNSIDDPYQYPTRGSKVAVSLAITPPYSLFDGKDYSQPMTDQERYRWIEYHKWGFDFQWFTPLSNNKKLVLMTRAQFGYLGAYDQNKRSPFEGFQMGGDGLNSYSLYGVQTVGLRGYENGSLTPNDRLYANIYSKYTVELRYPLVREGGTLVYANIFAEAGNAFISASEFKPFVLKKSAGVGLKLYLPILGLLGIDWGYGFDPTPTSQGKASGSQLHFTMGMTM